MLVPTCLYRGQPGSSSTTLYTVTDSADKYAIIKNIMIHNADSVARNLELYSVASGGSVAAANKFWDADIAAGETVQIDISMVLGRNETLRAIAGSASAVTLIVSGVIN